ncbi:MAG: NAD-dependent epimerase/dehydratase family protein [Bryobacteraceae bacterium]
MKKRVLLTGASGFVGANLARRLLGDGHELHLLLRPAYKRRRVEELQRHVHMHEADLEDGEGLTGLVSAIRPEWIFHLAVHGAYAHQSDAARIMRANMLGTVHLLEACLRTGFDGFVNTGSSSEYGFKDHAPDEQEQLDPNSVYGVSKAACTMYCRHTATIHKLHIPTLRLYSVYGAWEEPTRLVPTLLRHALRGEWPPLASPDSAHDFVHVDDVVDAFVLAAATPGQPPGAVYNVGSGVQTTLAQLVEIVKGMLPISAEPLWRSMPGRIWDANTWVAGIRRIQETLNWHPRTGLRAGLARTLEWMRERGET